MRSRPVGLVPACRNRELGVSSDVGRQRSAAVSAGWPTSRTWRTRWLSPGRRRFTASTCPRTPTLVMNRRQRLPLGGPPSCSSGRRRRIPLRRQLGARTMPLRRALCYVGVRRPFQFLPRPRDGTRGCGTPEDGTRDSATRRPLWTSLLRHHRTQDPHQPCRRRQIRWSSGYSESRQSRTWCPASRKNVSTGFLPTDSLGS